MGNDGDDQENVDVTVFSNSGPTRVGVIPASAFDPAPESMEMSRTDILSKSQAAFASSVLLLLSGDMLVWSCILAPHNLHVRL